MAKFLLLWKMSNARIPEDSQERGAGWGALLQLVENDIERGIIKDWGSFPGEGKGFVVFEGSNMDLMKMTSQYNPFVMFETHPVASILEVKDFLKMLSG